MFFYILMYVAVIFCLFPFIVAALSRDIEWFVLSLVAAIIPATIMSVAVLDVWSSHARDLSIIDNQNLVVANYELRIESLNNKLSKFNYQSPSLLNADTPVASIVATISEAETELMRAKTERANAIKNVEARRLGPLSGVISFAGDYK